MSHHRRARLEMVLGSRRARGQTTTDLQEHDDAVRGLRRPDLMSRRESNPVLLGSSAFEELVCCGEGEVGSW